MKLFYTILFLCFILYTYGYNSLSDILLEKLNLTIEDVTNHLNNKIIKTPPGYEESPTITVSGKIRGNIIMFPYAYEYLEIYDAVAYSICVYYNKIREDPVLINITQHNDGIYLSSINETIIPTDTWTCINIPETMVGNLYSSSNRRHLSVGFKVSPSKYVNTSIEPFMELYLKSDQFNAVTHSIQNDCHEFCSYKLEDVNIDLLTALKINKVKRDRYKIQFFYSVSTTWLNPRHHNNPNPIITKDPSIPYYDICSLRYGV